MARPHAPEGLEPVGHPLPGILVEEHQHPELAVRLGGDRMEETRLHRGDHDRGRGLEPLGHHIGEPGRDHDLPQGHAVGGVHPGRVAVVEALVVLDEVELPPAARRGRRHRLHRLPGGGDHHVTIGHAGRAPLGHPPYARLEARHPVGAAPRPVAPPRGERALHRHEQRHLVAPAGEAVGVDQDRAHPARDAQVRAEERDLHGFIWPSTPARCGDRRPGPAPR